MKDDGVRQWSDPVKDKKPREETLEVKGDLGGLKDILRRVLRKREEDREEVVASKDRDL